jgi:hypothetical protein
MTRGLNAKAKDNGEAVPMINYAPRHEDVLVE